MANDKLYIYDQDNITINVFEETTSNTQIINDNPVIEVLRIYEPGSQGPRGEDGTAQIPNLTVTSSGQIDFYIIQNAPFYPIISGSLFGSTSSFAFFGTFSSSLLPWSNSFDLGSITNPWKNLYITNSIYFVNGNTTINQNNIQIGSLNLTTSSLEFEDYIIKRVSNNQQIFKVQSGSISSSFTDTGQFLIPSFQRLPSSLLGSIAISGSDFFVGI